MTTRRCSRCHGTHVEVLRTAWFDANTDECAPDDYNADELDTWCSDCEETGVPLEEAQ